MSSDGSADGREELEELGTDAIVAHHTEAHLPQKRARVADEPISVVISEPIASAEPFTPPPAEESTLTHGEATLVLGDRKDLEAARRRILARRRGTSGKGGLLWLALAVVGGFALLMFFGMRLGLTDRIGAAAPIANNAQRPAQGAPSASPGTVSERPPRKVSLDELPVERPAAHP